MTRLSNRQYPMLLALCDNGENSYMPIEDAPDGTASGPFRSMLIRKWAAMPNWSRGFVTREGQASIWEFCQPTSGEKTRASH